MDVFQLKLCLFIRDSSVILCHRITLCNEQYQQTLSVSCHRSSRDIQLSPALT